MVGKFYVADPRLAQFKIGLSILIGRAIWR